MAIATQTARKTRGFTMIETLATAVLVTIIATMGLTILPVMKRAQIQTRALAKLKELAAMQESYRNLGDLGLNPDGGYGTFENLQQAGYIAQDIAPEDDESHSNAAFLPYYKVSIGRSIVNMKIEPDPLGYALTAEPVGGPPGLSMLFMQEDGEIFTIDADGTRRVLR